MYRKLFKSMFAGVFLLLPITASADIEVNEQNFPDYNFRKYLLVNYSKDGSFVIDEKKITNIHVYRLDISSLKGIEHFTSLKSLDCGSNPLTELDVTKNKALTSLDCPSCQLTSLNVSGCTALETLQCYNNNNQMTLNASGCTALKRLSCDRSKLISLNISGCRALTSLNCSSNQLTSLDVSKNTALTSLDCSGNQLTSLDVSKNTALTGLQCSSNQLTSLDVSKNTKLTSLQCSYNQLASLDLSGCTALVSLYCHANQLTKLDVSKNNKIVDIVCFSNKIKGTNMDAFISTLPMTFGRVDIFNAGYDGNVCYKRQVKAIKDKYWTPYYEPAPNDDPLQGDWVGREGFFWYEYNGEEEPDGGIEMNEENFPDENFRYSLESTMEGRDNIFTDKEIESITSLDINGCQINNMKGIEFFTSLQSLYCYDNQISGAAMDKLISLLPDRAQTSSGTIVLYNIESQTEGNVCTKAQVATLKAKNWNVYSTNGEYSYRWGMAFLEMYKYYGCDAVDIAISEENFPDENFRSYLLSQSYGKDGILTNDEIAEITYLDISSKNISRLEGIGYFTALIKLDCYFNQLTSLDMSNNTALAFLNCCVNQLTSLDVSKNTALTNLNCSSNQLTSLDVSKNTALTELWCYFNQLTALDVSKNTALIELDCFLNQLTSLDVSKNTALTELWCYRNQIKGEGMDQLINSLPQNMTAYKYYLYIYDNTAGDEGNVCTKKQAEAIKAKGWIPRYHDGPAWEEWKEYEGSDDSVDGLAINEQNFPDENFRSYLLSQSYGIDRVLTDEEILGITDMRVDRRNIRSLKGIEYFTALTDLNCSSNQLTSLDVSKNTALTFLTCDYNELTSLDVSGCTSLTYLTCYNNQINSVAMDAFISTLADRSGMNTTASVYIYGSFLETEGNVCTKTQVAAIKAKNWIPLYSKIDKGWVEYEGFDDEEDAINDVQADGEDAPVYRLDGTRVTQPKRGEIYIKNGRKVLRR